MGGSNILVPGEVKFQIFNKSWLFYLYTENVSASPLRRRRTVVQNVKKSDKKGKNEKFTSITKIINLRTSGFRFLSPNLFMPLDIFFEVINCF